MSKKSIYFLFGMCTIALSLVLFFTVQRRKSTPYIQALANNSYIIEAEYVIRFPESVWRDRVVEWHNGENYSIEYTNKSYSVENGQYYLREDNSDRVLCPTPNETERYLMADMFARWSVTSNYDFSNAKFVREVTREIPELETGNPILCDCDEYIIENAEDPILFCFRDGELYAIHTSYMDNFIFYIDSFETLEPRAM